MHNCDALFLYNDIRDLLYAFHDKGISPQEQKTLQKLIRKWKKIDCPEIGCNSSCLYGKSENWAEYHGYKNLYELLNGWNTDKLYKQFPQNRKATDIMNIPGIRYDGNPYTAK